MAMVAEAVSWIEEMIWPMIGVIGWMLMTTRTDARLPVARAEHVLGGLVHVPDGAVVASQLRCRLAFEIWPMGVIDLIGRGPHIGAQRRQVGWAYGTARIPAANTSWRS